MPVFPTVGSFPLTGVAGLPNITVAFPGEHWSNRIAQAAIVPGEAVVPVSVGGKLGVRRATTGDTNGDQMGIATRVIAHPDIANDSNYTTSLSPNQIKNLQINTGEYVHVYYSGVFHMSLVTPRAWAPAERVVWNPTATRPTGKAGTGAWDVAGATGALTPVLFEVMEFRPFSANGQEGLLTVRSLRGQF